MKELNIENKDKLSALQSLVDETLRLLNKQILEIGKSLSDDRKREITFTIGRTAGAIEDRISEIKRTVLRT